MYVYSSCVMALQHNMLPVHLHAYSMPHVLVKLIHDGITAQRGLCPIVSMQESS